MTMAPVNRFEWLTSVTRDAELPAMSKVVATALAMQFANHETGKLCPAVATIAEFIGASVRAVQRAIKALEDAGWLHRTESRGRGSICQFTLRFARNMVPFQSTKSVHRATREKGDETVVLNLKEHAERVTKMARKGDETVASRIEQSQEQKEGGAAAPSAKPPAERPAPYCRAFVPRGSDLEREWSRWLAENGLPGLPAFAPMTGRDGAEAWDLPWTYPPRPDDAVQCNIIGRFISWGTERRRHFGGGARQCA